MKKKQLTDEQVRRIFGLKLQQIRTENGLSLFGLSKLTGLSKSYLNEIERGKKYPKPDKVVLLVQALNTSYDELVSMKLEGRMAPLSDIIQSGILKDIPLDLFGIEEADIIDIIADAPQKVSAFITTMFEVARNYDVTKENFYLAALRSYQESQGNYFEDIEQEVRAFATKFQLDLSQKIKSQELIDILKQEFGYTLDFISFREIDYPREIRSIYVPHSKKLLIADSVSEQQRVFILAKELGFAQLKITERPLTFTWIKFESFEDVLNNFKASYFAGSLIIPEKNLVQDVATWLQSDTWNPDVFLEMMFKYTDSAETFFQRLTNILPRHFGLKELFFLRLTYSQGSTFPDLNKELHLARNHQPHAIKSLEHYCQRWISTDILKNPLLYPEQKEIRTGIQRSLYQTGEEYIIITASNADPFAEGSTRSVCIGILLSTKQKKKIGFRTDPKIPVQTVGVTCERCAIEDCTVRAAPPNIYLEQKKNIEIEKKVYALIRQNKSG